MRVGELPDPWRADPYLLGEHAHAEVLAAWPSPDALVAVLRSAGRGCAVLGMGDPAGVARLVVDAADALVGLAPLTGHVTLERGASETLPADLLARLGYPLEGSAWDWMWTPEPLAADRGRAERLPAGAGTAAEVAECLSRAHPTASTPPDDERVVGWWGVRRAGRLQAVVGAILPAPGLPPHLVSLGVDPEARGQGLAGMVMSAAVLDCLDVRPVVGPPMVTLGLYAANDTARRVYLRLGFRLHRRFATRRRPS